MDQIRDKQKQQINQPLDALRKIAPLIAAESKFVQLVARQRLIVDQLDRFRKLDSIHDQADRQEIVKLREQESEIRRAMSELMDEIESQAEKLGDDPDLQDLKQSSLKFVAAIRSSQIDPALAEARRSLSRFHGSDSYAHALAALEEMEKFLRQCQSNSAAAGQCLKKKFAPGLPREGSGNSLAQMLAQMGLNPGNGSGYSMRGNSGQNIGLYGNQPFAQRTGSGRGETGGMTPSRGERSVGSGNNIASQGMMELPETARTSARDVPLRYRKQTEIYLRRLAEQVEHPSR